MRNDVAYLNLKYVGTYSRLFNVLAFEGSKYISAIETI